MLDLAAAFTTHPTLHTERLMLRAVTPDDAADLLPIWADDRVNRFLGRASLTSLEEAQAQVERMRGAFEQKTGFAWVITSRADSKIMGTFVLWHLHEEHQRAEIGYVLSPDWWGQGVVVEAGRAVLEFAFTVMGLHSAEAMIDPENTGSR